MLRATHYDTANFEATLLLNHKGGEPLEVELVVYSPEGEERSLGVRESAPQSAERVELGALVAAAGGRFRRGSLEVHYGYEGCPLVISAALVLEGPRRGIVFDQQLDRAEEHVSSRLAGVGWLASRRGRATLWMTNHSGAGVEVELRTEGEGRRKEPQRRLRLGPHESRQVRLQEWERRGRYGGVAGRLELMWEGEPEAVTAWGWLEEPGRGFSASLQVVDPAAAGSFQRWGGGLRLGDRTGRPLVPVLVVGNLAEAANPVQVRLPYTLTDGTTGEAELEAVELGPGEVANLTWELWAAVQEIWREAVAGTGPVVAELWAMSWDQEEVYRVPLVDPQRKAAAGVYPWTLAQGTQSRIYLTNVTEQVQQFTLWLGWEGGQYVVEAPELEAGQTYVLDVGELLDRGEPDVHGNVVPAEVEAGQAHWSVLGPDAHAMVGRVEFVSADASLAATMACSNCCPDSLGSAYVTPNPAYGPIGGSVTLGSYARYRDCYGSLGPGFPVASSWTIGALQVVRIEIVTVSIFGEQVIVGVTVVMGEVYYASYVTGWQCQARPVSMTIGVEIHPKTPKLKGPSSVVRGQTATFEVVDAGSLAISNWQFSGGGGTVQRSGTGSTWSGTMVTSGSVSVQVGSYQLSRPIQVTPRSGWEFQAVPAQKVPNGYTPELTVPNPPPPEGGNLGKAGLKQRVSYTVGLVLDGGPNSAFFYVNSAVNSSSGQPTWYRWVVAPDLDNPSSTFFQNQCGDYDPVTKTGFISGALLRRNAIHHESANEPNSHYYQYVIAQDNPNNNVGVAAEGFVKPPEIGLEGFDQALRQLLEAKVKAIHDAVSAEPCGGHVNRDHSGNCEFLGNVNLPPYQPCP
ncbi:MAG TPA: hypothetical protein PLM33_04180 [Acidobacteriota bacterium]|nr:hypothetical protein [Acidobacteriota bacterium]